MLIISNFPDKIYSSDQRGFNLIEVLVSLLILSTGILGVFALQIRSTQFNQGALYQIRATILAEDYIDRMRSNAAAANLYRIGANDAIPAYTNCALATADCNAATLATFHKATWQNELNEVIPGAVVIVDKALTSTEYWITIQYNDDRISASSADGGTSPTSLTFRTVL